MSETIVFLLVFLFGIVLTVVAFYLLILPNYAKREVAWVEQLASKEDQIKIEQQKREHLSNDYQATKADLHHTHIKLEEQKHELVKLNEQLTLTFENIAHKVVQKSSEQLQASHEEKLKNMLTPLKERIASFEKRVEDTHIATAKDSESLKEQLRSLKELNMNIGEEAKNLTNALKGDKKLQGDWGEHRLERILQAAGLEKEIHYRKQVNLKNESSDNFRPDYIVYLPTARGEFSRLRVDVLAYGCRTRISYDRGYRTF